MTKTKRELLLQAAANGQLSDQQPVAIIYVRVSTKEQAEMGGDPEGFSIPAQREACLRKAESLGAVVAAEFVDRGESAKTANRPELRNMLTYVQEQPVTYLIVHKIDRLARSRADDVSINLEIQAAGVQLVSCTESIDATPSGKLLHGIMASIAEFYSRNLAAEVMKGSLQKAKNGGTPTKAPLGYVNVRQVDNGREHRTVIIDEDRAALMRFAFEAYGTGDWTLRSLLTELTKRGLTSRAGPRKLSGPLALSQFNRIMKNPYYIGIVSYQGILYPGKHEPLISEHTFRRVQEVLNAHDHACEKTRKFPHYLKGTVLCANCGSRLSVANNKGQSGIVYPYFYCLGRQRDSSSCDQKVILIEDAEAKVLEHYRSVQLSPAWAEGVRTYLKEELSSLREEAGIERTFQTKRITELKDQQRKLIQMSYAEAISLELLKVEQHRIGTELAQAEERLRAVDVKFETVGNNLDAALGMVTNCYEAYDRANTREKRHYNQAFFDWIKIGRRGVEDVELAAPFKILLGDELAARRWSKEREQQASKNGKQHDHAEVLSEGLTDQEKIRAVVLGSTGTDGISHYQTILNGQRHHGESDQVVNPFRIVGSPELRKTGELGESPEGENKRTPVTHGDESSSKTLLVGEGGLEPPQDYSY
jgi:site-specific DNA recombinase